MWFILLLPITIYFLWAGYNASTDLTTEVVSAVYFVGAAISWGIMLICSHLYELAAIQTNARNAIEHRLSSIEREIEARASNITGAVRAVEREVRERN